MLRLILALAVLAPAAFAQFPDINGQTSGNLPSTRLRFNYEIAGLPAANLNTNVVVLLTNGSAAAGDCTTVGSDLVWCYSNGTTWEPISGGGGGGETNTVSSNGTGVSLFAAKVGADLQFNSLVSQSTGALTVTLDDPNDEIDFTVDADLVALAGVASSGLLSRTGAGTATTRTLTGDSEIVVTNGDGVSGNPTLSIAASITRDSELVFYQPIDSDLTAIANNSTDGILYRTGAGTAIGRVPAGTANQITITNADGILGVPVWSIPTALQLPGTARLPNNTALLGRNAADNADVSLLLLDASDQVVFPNGLTAGSSGQGLLTLVEGAALTAPSTAGEHRLGFVTTESRLCSFENGGAQQCYALTSEVSGASDPVGANSGQSFTSQTSVGLTHSFGHNKLIVSCYDGSEGELGYDTLTIGAGPAYTATVTFASAQTGRCVVSGGGAAVYQASITAQTSFAVLAATHGLGTNAYVAACHDNSATPEQVGWGSSPRAANGDITINFATAFTGTCEIRQ